MGNAYEQFFKIYTLRDKPSTRVILISIIFSQPNCYSSWSNKYYLENYKVTHVFPMQNFHAMSFYLVKFLYMHLL